MTISSHFRSPGTLTIFSCRLLVRIALLGSVTCFSNSAFADQYPEKLRTQNNDNSIVVAVELNGPCVKKCDKARTRCVNHLARSGLSANVCQSEFSTCHMRCENGSPVAAPTQSKKPDTEYVTLPMKRWSVGKWPEGIVSDGQSLWVAESGARNIAEIDPIDGRTLRRVKVGRLPVGMASTSDGRVFALVATDKILWSQPKRGRGGVLSRLHGYPEDIAGDNETLWVLTHPGDTSERTVIERVNQRSGKVIRSKDLSHNGSALTLVNGKVWVVHGYSGMGMISLVDSNSLGGVRQILVNRFVTSIAAVGNSVFVSGRESDISGLIVKFDAGSESEVARVVLADQFVQSVVVADDYVIAAGRNGLIWILAADDLSILRVIESLDGPFTPRSVLTLRDTLYITSYDNDDKTGAIVVVDGWKPGTKAGSQNVGAVGTCRASCNTSHDRCMSHAQQIYGETGEKATARDAGEDCNAEQLRCFRSC